MFFFFQLHARCIRNEEHDTEINKTNKPMGTFGWTNRPSSTFVQAPSTNRIQTVSATRELSLETTTIATMSKGSWNVATKKLDLIALPATVTEAPVAEEPFFLSSTDNYGFYMESSNALPPAIQPSSRNSEDEIQVEPR